MTDVGIIITTYGKSRLWENAVLSVVNQSANNITVVLSDDGTPEFDINEAYNKIMSIGGNRLREVVVRKNNKNLGTVKNVNLAIQELKTKYLLLLAGDDELYDKDVIEKYVKVMEAQSEYKAIVG